MAKTSVKCAAVAPDLELIRKYFGQTKTFSELRNPHIETRVSSRIRQKARKSAILIPLRMPLEANRAPSVLVTKRQAGIRFAGHICFPGGHTDPDDPSIVATALREAQEEIDLQQEDVEVLGCLGDYYTQTGYQITPVVGIIGAETQVYANPKEVAAVVEISLKRMLEPENYTLTWHDKKRAHFSFSEQGIRIAGPTVSIMIGFLEALANYSEPS
ncbi:MAG: CoA pyrophosphatase [Pseudomonadales bacterium]|nr:CoA pyrophosphatase [Pseudomonadales bacterium]